MPLCIAVDEPVKDARVQGIIFAREDEIESNVADSEEETIPAFLQSAL